MATAGEIEILVHEDGYPVWCDLSYRGERLCKLHHKELSDLEYVVQKAIKEARDALDKFGEFKREEV